MMGLVGGDFNGVTAKRLTIGDIDAVAGLSRLRQKRASPRAPG